MAGREHSSTLQQKIGLKIYWAWPHPSEQDLDSHTASPSHQEASTSLLSLSTSRHGPQSCLTQWNYEPGPIGPLKMGGSWWRVLTKHGPLEKEMANHFSILTLRTPWTVWKCKKDRTLKDDVPRYIGTQYAAGEEWKKSSGKNEKADPKQKQHLVVEVTGDGSKVWCCKKQYCIETWNGRSMNQGKLEVVKKEMVRININILGISELKWTRIGKFN